MLYRAWGTQSARPSAGATNSTRTSGAYVRGVCNGELAPPVSCSQVSLPRCDGPRFERDDESRFTLLLYEEGRVLHTLC